MTLTPITIGSRVGTVLFFDDQWTPVARERASHAHVSFDDGGSVFYVVEPLRTAAFDPDQPRDDQGQWTNSGNGTLTDPSDTVNLETAEKGGSWYVAHWSDDTQRQFTTVRHAYFTPSAELDTTNIQEAKGALIEGVLTLRRPIVLPADDMTDLGYPKGRATLERLKKEGYDGAISDEQGWEIVAFSPETAFKETHRRIDPFLKTTNRALAASETLVHAAADAHVASFQVAVSYAFAMGRRAVDKEALRTAPSSAMAELAMADVPEAVRLALLDVLPGVLTATLKAGGEAGALLLQQQLRAAEGVERTLRGPVKPSLKMRFDVTNPNAVEWIKRHAVELATNLSETTRQQIADALVEAFESGDSRTGYKQILAAVGDEDRARLIARNETMVASGEGQRESWRQAVEEGLLTGGEQRVWIVTPDDRLCSICEDLEDKRALLGGMFTGSDGTTYGGPPAHIQCRCTEGIIG